MERAIPGCVEDLEVCSAPEQNQKNSRHLNFAPPEHKVVGEEIELPPLIVLEVDECFDRTVQRGAAVLAGSVEMRAVVEEQLNKCEPARFDGLVERRHRPAAHGGGMVHAEAFREEQVGEAEVAAVGGPLEGGSPASILHSKFVEEWGDEESEALVGPEEGVDVT